MPKTKSEIGRSRWLGIRVPWEMWERFDETFQQIRKGNPFYRMSDHGRAVLEAGLEASRKTKKQ